MKENVIIRNERKEDWEIVETITRQAFYNLYVPGCVEHYLVHNMREHEDFISELDFVSVGTMDLTFAFGVPGETNHPEIIEIKREIYRRVIASGKSALDKTPNQIALDEARQSGINCLYINSDTTLLKKGVDDLIGIIRA